MTSIPQLLHMLSRTFLFLAACTVLSGAVRAADVVEAGDQALAAALQRFFPDARIVEQKRTSRRDRTAYECKLSDPLNRAEPYKVVVITEGEAQVWEEAQHRISQRHVPAAVVSAFDAWTGGLKGSGEWEVWRDGGEARRFKVKRRGPYDDDRYEASFAEDGTRLEADSFPRVPGDLRATDNGIDAARAPAPAEKTAPEKPVAEQPAAEKPNPEPLRIAEESKSKVDPDVLRKVRKLIEGTLDKDVEARTKAWKELREMGNLIVPGLVELYKKEDTTAPMVRSILIALSDSKEKAAGPALEMMLDDKTPLIRRDAARAIGATGYKKGVPALTKVLSNEKEDEEVRLFAATAAAKLESKQALDVLAGLLKSEKAATRTRAVFALGAYGGDAQAPVIEPMLKDSDRQVRADGIEALRRIGSRAAWGPLVGAVEDEDYKVRNQAMSALSDLTGQPHGRDADAWKKWWAAENGKSTEQIAKEEAEKKKKAEQDKKTRIIQGEELKKLIRLDKE